MELLMRADDLRPAARLARIHRFPLMQSRPPAAGGELAETFRKLWRHRYGLLLCTVVGAILTMAALVSVPSRYVAEARLLVGIAEPRVLSLDAIVADMIPDAERVQNEMLIMQSRDFARAAVQRLGLANNPEFNSALVPPSWWRHMLDAWVVSPIRAIVALLPGPTGEAQSGNTLSSAARSAHREEAIVQALLSRVDVSVIGRSFVLSIKAQAQNPEVAAGIANTLADLYLSRQRQDKVNATGQAEQFLGDRIAELRKQVQAADQAVEQYRQRNGLFKGATTGITSQQLTELNTQLTLAQAAKAEAESRLREAQGVNNAGLVGETVPDVLRAPLIQSLKQQQVEAERRIAEISGTLGPRHPKMASARAELANIDRKLKTEIERTIAGMRHEANTAATRHDSLRRNLDSIKAQMGDVNKKSIQLDALERDAGVARTMLEETLRRSKQTVGQEQMMSANARLVSAAAPPLTPSVPPKALIAFLGTFGALLIGCLWAILRESSDRSFRRADQVVAETGLLVLSMIPSLRRAGQITSHVLRDPLSPYAESLRRLQIGLDMANTAQSPKTVLFASAVPAEGKSTLIASLGRMLASTGRRVLLVDCDWRCPSQARNFRCSGGRGLTAFLTGDTITLEEAVYRDPHSGLDIVTSGPMTPANMHLLASERMRATIALFAKAYDLVLIDTPPVLVGAEVLAMAAMVEKVVFTIRWGHTARDVALDAMRQVLDARGDIAGVALSRVDARNYRQYARSDLVYKYAQPALVEL